MIFQSFSTLLLSLIVGLSASAAPSIGGAALFLYRDSNFHKEDADATALDETPNGLNIQEVELKLNAEVDLHTELNVVLSIHSHRESDGTNIEEHWLIEPEEVYAENKSISQTRIKIGKFKAFMGKHNALHTHAFPFVEAPLANIYLLGDEGLNDVGASAAVLLPTSWLSEVTLQYLRGKGENEQFNSPRPGDAVGLTHWKNEFSINPATTIEIGGSLASGKNSFRETTTLTGADITFKWEPTESERYDSVTWSTEFLSRRQNQPNVDAEIGSGFASWIQYKFNQKWAAQYRYDTLKFENSFDLTAIPDESQARNTIAVAYSASEFSTVKLEVNQRKGGLKSATGEETENTVFLQFNIMMDAHAGHNH